MPELPEVETTRRGIEPHLAGQTIKQIVVRQQALRWPIPDELPELFAGKKVDAVNRRAKYLWIPCGQNSLILHLGMSGSLRVLPASTPAGKHDHVDCVLGSGQMLRFNDPRRFGCLLYTPTEAIDNHELIERLGPEPISDDFDTDYLYRKSRGRSGAVKNFIMNGQVVVGVGNIYASEALHQAGIMPGRAARRLSKAECESLVAAIKKVLSTAITAGGTTLRDFIREDGNPGYFGQELQVYGRAGQPCYRCGGPVRSRVLGQRSSFYCSSCQQ